MDFIGFAGRPALYTIANLNKTIQKHNWSQFRTNLTRCKVDDGIKHPLKYFSLSAMIFNRTIGKNIRNLIFDFMRQKLQVRMKNTHQKINFIVSLGPNKVSCFWSPHVSPQTCAWNFLRWNDVQLQPKLLDRLEFCRAVVLATFSHRGIKRLPDLWGLS